MTQFNWQLILTISVFYSLLFFWCLFVQLFVRFAILSCNDSCFFFLAHTHVSFFSIFLFFFFPLFGSVCVAEYGSDGAYVLRPGESGGNCLNFYANSQFRSFSLSTWRCRSMKRSNDQVNPHQLDQNKKPKYLTNNGRYVNVVVFQQKKIRVLTMT